MPERFPCRQLIFELRIARDRPTSASWPGPHLYRLFGLALARSFQSCGHMRHAGTLMLRDDKFVRGRGRAVLSGDRR